MVLTLPGPIVDGVKDTLRAGPSSMTIPDCTVGENSVAERRAKHSFNLFDIDRESMPSRLLLVIFDSSLAYDLKEH